VGPDPQVVVAEPGRSPPVEPLLLPELEPVGRLLAPAEPLHLHLFELAGAVDEVARRHLVAEGLADLGDAEGYLDAHRVQDVLVVQEDALRRLRPQVALAVLVADRADERLEHQVELARLGQIATAIWTRRHESGP
jgi:hypothetical protein